jgi:signal transduction histidine kinase
VTSEVAKGSTFEVEVLRSPEEPPERRRQYRRKEDKLAAAWLDSLVAHHHEKQRRRETLLSDVELPILASGPLPAIVTPPGASRVLLVEDNADLRTFLAHRLAARYRVETAADGILGLEAAGRVPPPDLIVSDVTMPRMDGYELCRRLRADPRLGTIPVILVTAKAGREAVIEGLDVGADDYVTKPFDLRELEARIDAHLRAKHLERRVAERDSRLAAIGRMTSAIVHDLKNPLAAIQGFAEMAVDSAESGADAATIRGDVENVLVGCGRLRTLLQELLDFAREGSLSLRAVATPVSSFTLATLGPLREELRRHGVALEVDVAVPAAVMCDLDKDRLERVIENMITNAREALAAHPPASGRPTVWVRVALESEASALSIRIADNGPGLPAELIGRLFEPFATAGKVKGTGLGLATVRNLVRAHGGDVNVEARGAEGGAAFTIRLPCPAERRSAPAGSPAPPAQRSPSDRTTGALAAGA